MSEFGKGCIWPDAAGTPTDPTVAYVLSSREIQLGAPSDLLCSVAVTGEGCSAIQILVEISTTLPVAWRTVQTRTIVGCPVGIHMAAISVPRYCLTRVSVRRYGGTANTLVTVVAEGRVGLGDLGHDGQPIELASAQGAGVVAWDDGAGVADALGLAMALGPAGTGHWIPMGPATELEVWLTSSSGPPTSVELQVEVSHDHATSSAVDRAINSVVAGVSNGMPHRVEQQSAPGTLADGTYLATIPVRPGSQIRVWAQRTGAAVDALVVVRPYVT